MDCLGHDLSGDTILVTGATGYLGGSVLAALRRRGANATGIGSRQSRDGDADLRDRAAVRRLVERWRPDCVVHCAARVPKAMHDYRDDAAAAESLVMVEHLIATGVPHIVFPSSMTVYTDQGGKPVREEDASSDLEGYALGKRHAEQRLCAATDLKATILRLPGLFGGSRRGGFIYNAARAFAAGVAPSLPPDPPLWAAMHVDDAAEFCARAAVRAPDRTMVLNAGYADAMSLCGVLADLAALFGTTVPACVAPVFSMDLTRLAGELGVLPSDTLARRLREVADLAASLTPGPVVT